ncbi:collagen alpha-1(XXVII) chain A-like protein [Lates japonicus]|uniref:Collagen alpha-1(XXVII) chain A-like protein n=1 Tax=Lates japonicus TaxID=270547 RepID=A0AAD3MDC6_LATJO|nr:collagen alpha-1(XXVII) chain A-like protein [Lates japonicus]
MISLQAALTRCGHPPKVGLEEKLSRLCQQGHSIQIRDHLNQRAITEAPLRPGLPSAIWPNLALEEGLSRAPELLPAGAAQHQASAHFEGAICQFDLVLLHRQLTIIAGYRCYSLNVQGNSQEVLGSSSLARSVAALAVRYVASTQTIKPNPGPFPTPMMGTVMPVTVQLGLASPPLKARTELSQHHLGQEHPSQTTNPKNLHLKLPQP